MGIAFFIPTSWNPQVFDSTGRRVPQRSSSLGETDDILAAVPVSRQARPLSDGGCLNVSRVMGCPQTRGEVPEACSNGQYCAVFSQHSGSVVK
jgi:hypothetical protein